MRRCRKPRASYATRIESGDEHGTGDVSAFEPFQTDEGGCFRIQLAEAEAGSQARAWLRIELGLRRGRNGGLRSPRRALPGLALLVRDPLGSPIAGAVARIDGPIPLSRASAPTDQEGESTLTFAPPGPSRVRVDALRFHTGFAEVGEADTLEIALAPSPSLAIRLLASGSRSLPTLTVVVVAPPGLYSSRTDPSRTDELGSELEALLRADLGAAAPARGRSRGSGPELVLEQHYQPTPEGLVLLADLNPGVSFSIEVRDEEERILAARGHALPGRMADPRDPARAVTGR